MTLKWWQRAIFYQIYPRSFADGNGDGIGDFAGMVERLDYLHDLSIDAIWLSPHIPSPFLDCGYDISNFTDVATIFEHPDLPDHALPLPPEEVLDANALDEPTYRQLLRWQLNQPGLHELMRELRALLDAYPGDLVLVGEDEDLAFHWISIHGGHVCFSPAGLAATRSSPLTGSRCRRSRSSSPGYRRVFATIDEQCPRK